MGGWGNSDRMAADDVDRYTRYEPAGLALQSVSRVTTTPVLSVDLLTCDLVATDNVGARSLFYRYSVTWCGTKT